MPPTPTDAPWPIIRRAARTVLVADLVESVRLIEQDEEDTVRRWQWFVGEVASRLLPEYGGRLVKSLGDGLMVELETVVPAIKAAFAMHQLIAEANHDRPRERWLMLRAGAHVADVIVDERDIYGSGVNLAARLSTLAQPGEIVVSSELRNQLTSGLDGELEDLGECFLKHLSEPVHAYRVHPIGTQSSPIQAERSQLTLVPTVAVIPFQGREVEPPLHVMGELIADSVIGSLCASSALRVISRLSTSALAGRAQALDEAASRLAASFVVSGTYYVLSGQLVVLAQLVDPRDGGVLWAERLSSAIGDVLRPESELVDRIASGVAAAITMHELRRARANPLPSLRSFSLQLSATALMHRSSAQEFERAREALEHLIERHPRTPIPRAWLAKWYVLRVTRGLVGDPGTDAARALEQTQRALDIDPECSLALAMRGFVQCHMVRDLNAADRCIEQALAVNPNDSLAWLFKCVTLGFRGEGEEAIDSAERAIALSPLDPLRHYYDGLGASAALAAGRLARAIDLAERSLMVNRNHPPALRALAIAQAESGAVEDARRTVAKLLQLQPNFTVREYLARGPRGGETTRSRYADALRLAGVPAG